MVNLTQLPSTVDLSFIAGDTFRIRVRVIDPASGAPVTINPNPGVPGELGEYTFCAEIASKTNRAIVSQFQVSPDPDSPNEAVILTLSKTDTAVLPGMGDGAVFNGVWDLEVTFPNKDVRTVASGTVTCRIDVSNPAVTP